MEGAPSSDPAVIFLDVDGVLNTTPSRIDFHVESLLCERLKTIIDQTGADIGK